MNSDDDKQTAPELPVHETDPGRQSVPPEEIPEDENFVDEPLADKSDVSAPMHDSEDPLNNARRVPGLDPDRVEDLRDESRQEIDFNEGRIRDVTLTQGRSVIDAEFDDRGPATHLNPDKDQ